MTDSNADTRATDRLATKQDTPTLQIEFISIFSLAERNASVVKRHEEGRAFEVGLLQTDPVVGEHGFDRSEVVRAVVDVRRDLRTGGNAANLKDKPFPPRAVVAHEHRAFPSVPALARQGRRDRRALRIRARRRAELRIGLQEIAEEAEMDEEMLSKLQQKLSYSPLFL